MEGGRWTAGGGGEPEEEEEELWEEERGSGVRDQSARARVCLGVCGACVRARACSQRIRAARRSRRPQRTEEHNNMRGAEGRPGRADVLLIRTARRKKMEGDVLKLCHEKGT